MIDLRCLTWNLHRCRGQDGKVDHGRTEDRLIALLCADAYDLVVLTEADGEQPPYGALLDLGRIGAATGLASAHRGASLRWGAKSNGFLGTIVLHGPRIEVLHGHLLDLPGLYPRGAVILTMRVDGQTAIRCVATHLSLGQVLRIAQMRAVGQYLARQDRLPTILIGDLNEWWPWGGPAFSRRVTGQVFAGPARRSFPSGRPVLPLDRVLATPPARVTQANVLTSPDLRQVSDHLPLRALVRLGQGL